MKKSITKKLTTGSTKKKLEPKKPNRNNTNNYKSNGNLSDEQVLNKLKHLLKTRDKEVLKRDGIKVILEIVKGWIKHEKIKLIFDFIKHFF